MKKYRHLFSVPGWLVLLIFVPTSPMVSADDHTTLEEVGHYSVKKTEFVYAQIGDVKLLATSYRPNKSGQLPALIDVHGGAWNLYDRNAGDLYNQALASSGIYVMAIDFRQGPDFQHPLGSRDTVAAIRYLKTHAKTLNIDSESIGLIGSSSGGHLAMLAGFKPNAAMHKGTPIMTKDTQPMVADNISANVKYIIAMWPVSDPIYRYGYAQRVGRERLVEMHKDYFGTEKNMADASIPRLLDDAEGEKVLPDLLIIQAGDDDNIPREMTFSLMNAYQNKNGNLEYAFFPGMPHAFGHRPSASTTKLIELMGSYIKRQLVSNVHQQN